MKFRLLLLSALLEYAFFTALQAQSVAVSSITPEQREAEIRGLRSELKSIAARLDALEFQPNQLLRAEKSASPTPLLSSSVSSAPAPSPRQESGPLWANSDSGLVGGTTMGFALDGYYGYNFNVPIGGVNLLRAYDLTSNSFNINQANLIVEHLPTPIDRMGGRIDLQFGQATETLQGSSANEQHPEVWRNVFQAYGSYLAPIGSGLQVDFGKFASSLGNEGNYTKDQIAYSRSYSFDFLPFYHMGFRANYNVTPKLNVAYWLVNGANDTDDLNGFKSQGFLFTLKPATTLNWNVNYYFGQETREVAANLSTGTPSSTPENGLLTTNAAPTPNGREHIFDTYATWNATPKLTLVPEADFVINRANLEQRPARVIIGSLAARYVLPHNWNTGTRFEYLDDRDGLFSGSTQALKEGTVVLDHLFTPNFLARAEYRRDFSNKRFFLTDTSGVLVRAQTTATLGLVYWWGTKQGSW